MFSLKKSKITLCLLCLLLSSCDDDEISSVESEELVEEIYVQHEFENILDPLEEGYYPEAPLSEKDAYIFKLKAADSLYDINGYDYTLSVFYEEFDEEGNRILNSQETTQTLALYADGYSILDGYRNDQSKMDDEIIGTSKYRRKSEVGFYNGVKYSSSLTNYFSLSRVASSIDNAKDEWLIRNDKHQSCLDYSLYSISGGFLALSTSSIISTGTLIDEEGETSPYNIVTNSFDACYFSGSVYQPRWVGRAKGYVVHSYINEDLTEATSSSRVTSYQIETYAFNNNEADEEEILSSFLESFGSYYVSSSSIYLISYIPSFDNKGNLISVEEEETIELPLEQYHDAIDSSSYYRCFLDEDGLTNNRVYSLKADIVKINAEFNGASEVKNNETISMDIPYISSDNNFYLDEYQLGDTNFFALSKWYLNGEFRVYLSLDIDKNSGDIDASATIQFE